LDAVKIREGLKVMVGIELALYLSLMYLMISFLFPMIILIQTHIHEEKGVHFKWTPPSGNNFQQAVPQRTLAIAGFCDAHHGLLMLSGGR